MSNVHLQDERLSLRAKGLLSYLLSLPDDWNFCAKGLEGKCSDGRDSVGAALRELEKCGYLERHQHRQKNGRMGAGSEYFIFEIPRSQNTPETALPDTAKPETVKPKTAKPIPVNPQLQNTNRTKDELDKGLSGQSSPPKPSKHKYGLYNNVLLSDSDMGKLEIEFPQDYRQRIDRLSEYMETHPKKHYQNHLAVIRSWARQDKAKQQQAQPPERVFTDFDADEGSW